MPPRHVLVVDDGCIPALNLHGRISKLGYEVISLSVGSDASIARSAKSKPDLAVMDFFYDTDTDDVSTAERVRAVLDIPVIFVTAEDLRRASADILQKPFDDRELKTAIDTAIDRNREIGTQAKLRPGIKKPRSPTAPISDDKGSTEAYELVCQIPAFKQLSEQAKKELVAQARFAEVAAGEYIAFEGDEDEASFIVVSGRFAMTKSSAGGKELIVQLLGPGDFVGMIYAIEKLPARLSARAQCDSEVLWIQTSVLLRVLKEHPDLYKGFMEYLAAYLHLSHTVSHGLAHDSVKVRIASLLLSLVAKFSRVRNELSSPIVIDITRQQIADLTGTTPETAIRVTRAMHAAKIINVSSPGVLRIVDIEALKKIAQEHST